MQEEEFAHSVEEEGRACLQTQEEELELVCGEGEGTFSARIWDLILKRDHFFFFFFPWWIIPEL